MGPSTILHISHCLFQLAQLYKLKEGIDAKGEVVPLVNNWRPPQPLNGRKVYSSFIPDTTVVRYGTPELGSSKGSDATSVQAVWANSLLLLVMSVVTRQLL